MVLASPPRAWSSGWRGHILWVKALPDYELFFSVLAGMRQDADRPFEVEQLEVSEENHDIKQDTGQVSAGVEILLLMSHNVFTKAEESIQ